jgi:hypothetical protein
MRSSIALTLLERIAETAGLDTGRTGEAEKYTGRQVNKSHVYVSTCLLSSEISGVLTPQLCIPLQDFVI